MMPSNNELSRISKEINGLTVKRQQLLERKKMLCIFDELKSRIESKQLFKTEDLNTCSNSHQAEMDNIDTKLKELINRKTELQCQVSKNVSFQMPPEPDVNVYTIEPPPTTPAPVVILDLEKLPPYPSRTQCPECKQFIITETFNRVDSFAWTSCCIIASIGCVVGCCLIPFCLDSFKSTSHRCPRCRTTIRTIKRF